MATTITNGEQASGEVVTSKEVVIKASELDLGEHRQTSGGADEGSDWDEFANIYSDSAYFFPLDEDLVEILDECFDKMKECGAERFCIRQFGGYEFSFNAESMYYGAIFLKLKYRNKNSTLTYGVFYFSRDKHCGPAWEKEQHRDKEILSGFRKSIDELFRKFCCIVPHLRQQLIDCNLSLISSELESVKTSFIEIGKTLYTMYYNNLYDTKQDFYDYIDSIFGFGRTTVKNMVGIIENFCTEVDGVRELATKYRDYSYSQLVEFIPLVGTGGLDLEKLSPGATIKAIREYKQELKEQKKPVALGQTSDHSSKASEPAEFKQITSCSEPTVAQAESLTFKNVKEREAWLSGYKTNFYLWLDVEPLGFKVYRYDLKNGVSILAVADAQGMKRDTFMLKGFQLIAKNRVELAKKYVGIYITECFSWCFCSIASTATYLTQMRDDI